MRAYIVQTGRRITPFNDAPGDALYAGISVGVAVRGALAKRGFAVVDVHLDDDITVDDNSVVIADHCFVSDKVLGDFLGAAFDLVAEGKSFRLALAKTPSVEFTLPLSSAATEPLMPKALARSCPARGATRAPPPRGWPTTASLSANVRPPAPALSWMS